MGCYAQTSPEEVKGIPGVDLVVGTSERNRIVDLLEQLDTTGEQPLSLVKDIKEQKVFEDIQLEKISGRARAYLKIQEGCEQFCSYCIIPYARGPVRSRTLENTLTEAQKLIGAGFKEIVLTGIHLGAYGRDLSRELSLDVLLSGLLALDKSVRWRVGSLEPTEVTPRLVSLMKENQNLCPHLHLPLQSAHDEILQAMNRPYKTSDYAAVLRMIRAEIPLVNITTDIMVGFPGETEEHFQAYLHFIAAMELGGLHVFQYSPRKGTPAAAYPGQVSAQVKEERSHQLIALGHQQSQIYAAKFMDRQVQVLAEKEVEAGLWEGHSENYLKIRFAASQVERGHIVPVTLTDVGQGYSMGITEPVSRE